MLQSTSARTTRTRIAITTVIRATTPS